MSTLDTGWLSRSSSASPKCDESPYGRSKRVLDIALGSVAFIAALPVALLVALAIRLDGRGPILYSQERVGLDRRRRPGSSPHGDDRRKHVGYGRPFTIYKFRSMVSDAEKHSGPVWATDQDPRATRVGAFLRRTHLDEIPQLINVLRGEMSMVGPRPERPQLFGNLVAEIPGYALRCRVVPGVTGIAQIKNGYDSSLESAARKVEYDLYYIRSRSLLLDLKIMAATALVLARGSEQALEPKEDKRASVEPRLASADVDEIAAPAPAPPLQRPGRSARPSRPGGHAAVAGYSDHGHRRSLPVEARVVGGDPALQPTSVRGRRT